MIEQTVIERLRKEKEESQNEYQIEGRKEGEKDGANRSYDDLVIFEKAINEIANEKTGSEYNDTHLIQEISDFEDLREHIFELGKNDLGFDRGHYLRGYIEGTCKFWQEVKDQL